MTKQQAGNAGARQRPRKAAAAFQPTREQRAFVATASGLGVPRSVICQMLPGARPGETVSISRDMLRREFDTELRDGLKIVVALVETRVFQRALFHDDRSALAAQMAVLNTRGGWKTAPGQATAVPAEPEWAMHQLTREERNELRKLLEKATPRRDAKE
jgi:hypothetical protein